MRNEQRFEHLNEWMGQVIELIEELLIASNILMEHRVVDWESSGS